MLQIGTIIEWNNILKNQYIIISDDRLQSIQSNIIYTGYPSSKLEGYIKREICYILNKTYEIY